MSYYIKAYKGPKQISIPVEEKHKYFNYNGSTLYNTETQLNFYDNSGTQQYKVEIDKFKIIHNSNNFTLTTGAGASDIIGDKVQVKDIDYTIYLRLNIDKFINDIPHGYLQRLWVNFRIMTVHFDQSMGQADLSNWFKRVFIHYNTFDNATYQWAQSCHQDMLTESNPYTGKFKILYDKKIKLTYDKGVKQIHYKLTPNMNVTFDNTSNPTNSDFRNTYTFIIAPIAYHLDMDGTTYHYVKNFTISDTMAYASFNIKYTFYDLN